MWGAKGLSLRPEPLGGEGVTQKLIALNRSLVTLHWSEMEVSLCKLFGFVGVFSCVCCVLPVKIPSSPFPVIVDFHQSPSSLHSQTPSTAYGGAASALARSPAHNHPARGVR